MSRQWTQDLEHLSIPKLFHRHLQQRDGWVPVEWCRLAGATLVLPQVPLRHPGKHISTFHLLEKEEIACTLSHIKLLKAQLKRTVQRKPLNPALNPNQTGWNKNILSGGWLRTGSVSCRNVKVAFASHSTFLEYSCHVLLFIFNYFFLFVLTLFQTDDERNWNIKIPCRIKILAFPHFNTALDRYQQQC